MDRPSIQRSDFPTVRRGYEPDAVDAHLRSVADEVESLRGRGSQPVAAAASSQVQRIIEAAESTADQLREEAGEEAREHVHRVSTAARELLERLGAMHDELGDLMDRLREDAGRLSSELRALEADVVEIGPTPEMPGPEDPLTEAEIHPEPEPEPEPGPEAEADPAPPADERPDDVEAARLVALDMALAGTPREETERYLAEHYALADPSGVLDDVYALAGS
jgi:DivIVA domain-containing protein